MSKTPGSRGRRALFDEGIAQFARVSVNFDEDHLLPDGGLVVAGLLAAIRSAARAR